jgi:hypothetical protein
MLVGQAKRPHYHHASHQAKLQYASHFWRNASFAIDHPGKSGASYAKLF